MINTPPGYWHLGTADSLEYATEIAEKNKQADGGKGYMIVRRTTDQKITWLIFAKEEKWY